MQDTPIHLNGPFTMRLEQGHHVIRGRDGVPICELAGKLIDGGRRIDKYPDGMIRTEQARAEEAAFVLAALNAAVAAFLPKP
jgi:hypothetical protein